MIRGHGHAEDRPAGEIALLRLLEMGGQLVNAREHAGGVEDIGAERGPAIHVTLREIRVFKEPPVPGVFRVVPLRPEPVLGFPAFARGGIAEGEVHVPDGFHLDPATAILLVKRAETKSIHVLGRLDHQVVVDE